MATSPAPTAASVDRCNDPQCARRGVVAALREVKRRSREPGGWRAAVDEVMREHGATDVDAGTPYRTKTTERR